MTLPSLRSSVPQPKADPTRPADSARIHGVTSLKPHKSSSRCSSRVSFTLLHPVYARINESRIDMLFSSYELASGLTPSYAVDAVWIMVEYASLVSR
jgi:hypothetical protein